MVELTNDQLIITSDDLTTSATTTNLIIKLDEDTIATGDIDTNADAAIVGNVLTINNITTKGFYRIEVQFVNTNSTTIYTFCYYNDIKDTCELFATYRNNPERFLKISTYLYILSLGNSCNCSCEEKYEIYCYVKSELANQ